METPRVWHLRKSEHFYYAYIQRGEGPVWFLGTEVIAITGGEIAVLCVTSKNSHFARALGSLDKRKNISLFEQLDKIFNLHRSFSKARWPLFSGDSVELSELLITPHLPTLEPQTELSDIESYQSTQFPYVSTFLTLTPVEGMDLQSGWAAEALRREKCLTRTRRRPLTSVVCL